MRPLLLALCLLAATSAGAATFRWSSQGDYLSADPHAQNEGLNNNVNDFIFEKLTTRGKDLALQPALAVSWEAKSPTLWRFNLRKGVTFHDGTPFTADDVVFSIERAQLPSSNFKVYAGPVGKPRRIDDYTVEIETPGPSPLIHELLNSVRIMSKAWCVKNGALKPQDFKTGEETFASRNANGTGPYILVKREPEVGTTLRKNPNWWGIADKRFEGNVDEIVYRPIKSDATRMAALVTGEIDFVQDPALQDIPRLRQDAKLKVVEGLENRVIFLVMDQERDTLKYSNVKGKNPLKDLRVRQALYAAIDVEAIQRQVMRGLSKPTGAMVPTISRSFPPLEPRLLPFDPAKGKKLLADAGYPDGFEVGLLCPNNRYVNDERICTAITSMWAKIGVKAKLETLPRAQFFQRVDQFDHSIHMYGWGGAATDPGFTVTPILHSRTGTRGDFNSGRYRDPELDKLGEAAEVELDTTKRSALLLQALQRAREGIYTIPLHRQVIPWAMRSNIEVVHRADNVVTPEWVRIR